MKTCPFMSYRGQYYEVNCLGECCGLADENGECLIRQALEKYVRHNIIEIEDKPTTEEIYTALLKYEMEKM